MTILANRASGSGTLTLNILNDTENEGDETIIVGGSSGELVIKSAVITIHDDEATYLSITGPTAEVAEGSSASFTVSLSKAVTEAVTVAWNDVPGTATAGTDYTAASGTVTFAANSSAGTTKSITIATTDDSLSETAETFDVAVGAVSGDGAAGVWVKSTAATAEATIAESDAITVSLSGPPSSVFEGDTATYTVSLSGGTPTEDLTVDYATADGTGNNAATAPGDYEAKSGTLTFTPTDHADKTVTVQTTEDIQAESFETFSFALSNPLGGGGPTPTLGSPSSVTTTIDDDDSVSAPPQNPSNIVIQVDVRLSVEPDSVKEGAGSTDFTVTATRTGAAQSAEVAIPLTLGGTAEAGTGKDYTAPASASVTIPANETSGTSTLTLDILNDTEVEGDETIIVGGTSTGLKIASDTITIHDDEATYLSIAGPTGEVAEGGNATFTVTLAKSVPADVKVVWFASRNLNDYSPHDGSVTFPANSGANATQTFTIPVTDDNLSEPTETFTVDLGADSGDQASIVYVDTTADSATATIAESDPITVSISGPASVAEGATTTDYTVSISGGDPTADLTVDYATADGTATAGTDYTAKPTTTLTFTPDGPRGTDFQGPDYGGRSERGGGDFHRHAEQPLGRRRTHAGPGR